MRIPSWLKAQPPPASHDEYPLGWVDGFIDQVRQHLFLREADNLLIVMPNQSYRLNATGVALLKGVLNEGKPLAALLGDGPLPPQVQKQIFHFFSGLVAMVKGCLGEGRGRPQVEQVEYRRPHHKLPVLSEVALTYRCNLACVFCYAGCRRCGPRGPKPISSGLGRDATAGPNPQPLHDGGDRMQQDAGVAAREMGLNDLEVIFHKIRHQAQTPSVSLTGGEPTLRSDLPEVVSLAVAAGLRVNLISNGIAITPQLARRLKEAGLSSAQVSLEGPNDSIHDRLTGVAGSFQATLAGIEALRAQELTVHTNTTLCRDNVVHATAMAPLVAQLGLGRFSMNMVIPTPWLMERSSDLVLRYDEIGPVLMDIKEAARVHQVTFMWYSPTPYCLFNPIAHGLGGKGCGACDGLLSIDPSGGILPCSSFFEPQGNLLKEDFQLLWNSLSARSIRDKERAPVPCRSCELMELCEGACPLYWDAMGLNELTCGGHPSAWPSLPQSNQPQAIPLVAAKSDGAP